MGVEIYFPWEMKRDGALKDAVMFCCLGEAVKPEQVQGAKGDDGSRGPVECNQSGADTWMELGRWVCSLGQDLGLSI